MKISVIICAYNPDRADFARVLDSLKNQTLAIDLWELIIVDNNSKQAIAPHLDMNWHPNGRFIFEGNPGKTSALVHGIEESTGEVILLVDQDNVLKSNYLEESLRIEKAHPFLGAWGGQWFPEFEGGRPSESWRIAPYELLVERDVWSNNYDIKTTPFGAGVSLRRIVALRYATEVATNPLRLALDRRGNNLGQNGDVDLAFVACDMGMGIGRFKSLEIIHLIPKSRTENDYLIRLAEGGGYSQVMMDSIRGVSHYRERKIDRAANLIKGIFMSPIERKIISAYLRGKNRAIEELNG